MVSTYLKADNGTIGKILKFQNPLFLSKPKKVSISLDKSLDLKSTAGFAQSQTNQNATINHNHSFLKNESIVQEVRK